MKSECKNKELQAEHTTPIFLLQRLLVWQILCWWCHI